MRVVRWLVVAALAVACVLPGGLPALAASAPVITALDVTEHPVPSPNFDAVIDWTTNGFVDSISVDLYNSSTGSTWTVTWPTAGSASGSYVVSNPLRRTGVYYVTNARAIAATMPTGNYSLYGNAPLLDDVWFAFGVSAPGVPTAPEVSTDTMGGPASGEIAVVCSNSDGNGLPILDYTLTATPVAGGPPLKLTHDGSVRCSDVIGGLTPGGEYDVTAVARTSAGVSNTSNSLRDVAMAAPPEAPTGLVATPGDSTALLDWEPAFDNGRSVTDYAIELRGNGGTGLFGTSSGAGNGPATFLDVSPLANGATYDFRVKARNDLGWGAWSAWSDPFTPEATLTLRPPAFKANWTDTGGVAVDWLEPTAPVGDPATGYEVEVSGAGALFTSGQVSCCSWTTSGAVDVNESYDVRMRAKNAAGWSDWSSWSTLDPIAPPGEVQGLTATGRYGRAQISWQEPLTGTPVGGYGYSVKELSPLGGTMTSATDQTTLRVDGLTPGVDYAISVWGIGLLGRTGPSQAVSLAGTQTTVRASTALTAGLASEIHGRSITTLDGSGIGGVTLVLQRRTQGASVFRSTDITSVTRPLGRFDLSFVPRAGVEYRVALVGQTGLGGSAAPLPTAA